MASGFRLFGRGKLVLPGAWAIAAAALVAGAAPGLRIPVPLNAVGATAAATAALAYLSTLPWAWGLTRDVPEADDAGGRRARRLRLGAFAAQALVLACLAVTGAAASTSVARFALQASFFLGLAGAMSAARANEARWLPGFAILTGMLVLGVDRESREPRAWAWLLNDDMALSLLRDVAPACAVVIGAIVIYARRSHATDG